MDYSGTDSFYQIIDINETQIKLREVDKHGYYTEIKTYPVTKVKRDFIKLSEFLEKAVFVGRKFTRTQPIIDPYVGKDASYMKNDYDDYKIMVLYATQDLFLVKTTLDELFDFEERYELINSRYTLDGKYIFFGPTHDEYKDVNKVYSEILKQISPNDKNKNK